MTDAQKNQLILGLNELKIEINSEQIKLLSHHLDKIQLLNKEINLTAITDELEIVPKHYLDSLSVCKIFEPQLNDLFLDLGTGAGYPGIPIAIKYPQLKVTLIDAKKKVINILNDEIAELGLSNVTAKHKRSEEEARENFEVYDFVVSRAVTKLNDLVKISFPLIKLNGYLIAMKGPGAKDELLLAENTIKQMGGEISKILEIELPFTDNKRTLIKIQKVRQISSKMIKKIARL